MGPDVELGRDFKADVINVLKEAKETMSKIKEKYDDNDSSNKESKLKNSSHTKSQGTILKWKIQ